MTSRTRLNRKQIDDVLGGDEAWIHADKTQGLSFLCTNVSAINCSEPSASCDKCNFDEAYFYQLQIRSADEPMTTCKASFLSVTLLLMLISLSVCMLLRLLLSADDSVVQAVPNALTNGEKIKTRFDCFDGNEYSIYLFASSCQLFQHVSR